MEQGRLSRSDYRFMSVVWENEPLSSGQLAKLCYDELGWKKSTTYTMLKKLAEKGCLKNENSVVSSLVSKDEAQRLESEYVVDNTFAGSLPAFVAAFMNGRTLSGSEVEELRRLIEREDEK